MPPAPAASGYSWVTGHYIWRDGRWTWEPGQWRAGTVTPMPQVLRESPPPASDPRERRVPGYWQFSGSDWVWVKGHWE